MPPIDTFVAKSNSRTETRGQSTLAVTRAPAQVSIAGLSKGLDQLAYGLKARTDKAQALLAARKGKEDELWSITQSRALQKELAQFSARSVLDPSPEAIDEYQTHFNTRRDEMLKDAPSDQAAESFGVRAGAAELPFMNAGIRERAVHDSIAATSQIGQMIADTQDLLVTVPGMATLDAAREEINGVIDGLDGELIGPKEAARLRKDLLAMELNAVDLWSMDSPELALEALDSIKGLSGSIRAAKRKNLNNIVNQGAKVDYALLNDDFNSYLKNVKENGKGSFDVDAYVAVHPADRRVGAKTMINDKIVNAEKIYSFRQEIKGSGVREVREALAKIKPGADVDSTHRDRAAYSEAAAIATHHEAMIESDPFTVAAASDVVADVYNQYEVAEAAAKADGEGLAGTLSGVLTPGAKEQGADVANTLFRDAVTANVALQADWGTPSGSIRYAPLDTLEKLVILGNTGTSQEIIDGLNSIKSLYGEYYPDVIGNLQDMPSGAGLSEHLSIIVGQIDGDNTPAYIHSYIDYNKLPNDKLGITAAEFNDIQANIANHPKVMAMVDVIYGGDSTTPIDDAAEIVHGLAKYQAGRDGMTGDKDFGKAVEQIIGKQYIFEEANGRSFSIPREVTIGGDVLTQRHAKRISNVLDDVLDVPNKRAGNPLVSSGVISFLSSHAGARANGTNLMSEEDTNDMLRTGGYWTWSKDGDGGLLLMASTGDMQAKPVIGPEGPVIMTLPDIFKKWDLDFLKRRHREPKDYHKYWE